MTNTPARTSSRTDLYATPTLTTPEALKVTEAIVERWPNPELGPTGLASYADSIAHLGLTLEQLRTAYRRLGAEHDTNFRPTPADFRRAAHRQPRPELVEWHPNDAGTTPADHIPPGQFRDLVTAARAQLQTKATT
jgi:hypothetical protein